MMIYALFILTAFIGAQETIQSQTQTTMVQQEPGKPIIVKWSETHQGILKVYPQVSPVLSLPFRVHENLCAPTIGQTCVFKTQFSEPWIFLAWHKHPDSKKIGQIIKQKSSGEFLEDNDTFLASEFKNFFPQLAKKLKSASIECSDYSWIPGSGQKTAPNALMISRWEIEFMVPNQETGISENRTIGGVLNLELTKNKSTLELQKAKALTSGDFTPPTLVFGDNFSWTLKDKTGDSCQIAFKPGDFSRVQATLDELRSKRPDSKDIKSYILQSSDELLYFPDGVSSDLSGFWQFLDTGDLE